MQTKLDAGKIATAAGTAMVIARGRERIRSRRLRQARAAPGSSPSASPVTARKPWISGQLETRGALTVDDGAVKALRAGKSLLPAGVRAVKGHFQRGDTVAILGPDGEEVGRGLVAYDAADAERIAGRNSARDRGDPRLRRPRRDDPPRRHGPAGRVASPPTPEGTTMTDTLPDRLSTNPKSPYYDEELLARDVGIRFKGEEKTNVEEYCVSEGWIRVAAGNAKDRHGNPLTIKLNGPVEPYFRDAPGRRYRRPRRGGRPSSQPIAPQRRSSRAASGRASAGEVRS